MSFIPSEGAPAERPQPPAKPGLPRLLPVGWLTAILISVSIAATLACGFGKNTPVLVRWVISEFDGLGYGIFMPEIEEGQVWRLLTPIFIHFDAASFVFDLLGLAILGALVERKEGKWSLLAQVIVFGAASNFAQFVTSGPVFGGMSGVLYGLLGRLWIKSRLEPDAPATVSAPVAIVMVGWLGLCMTGRIPHAATYAQGVGLGLGALWGFVSVAVSRRAGKSPRV